ncbi:transglutaminase family protein [Pseudohoeflea coraliihabitans]|uniref:Transglutaminase family protein n=1 Tax=Pseudohoeflea coraliihabitans TaxID=2860393 RepID=A0ABS6WMR6_9HYPH|nr:transglutaminase family protein [Pseudohoeflea sp. DP4N28-3]MBW3097070.1 transglutaminase family protein [Pseudohoeflea sp. DP4N28-3]
MLYDVRLIISHHYPHIAVGVRQMLRLMPAARPGHQRLIAAGLTITPPPAHRGDAIDFFGNAYSSVAFDAPLEDLLFKVSARVEVTGPASAIDLSAALEDLPRELSACRDLGPASPLHFIAPTPRTPEVAEIAAYALEVTRGAGNCAEAVFALGRALHRDMRFDPEATTVDTPAAEAFRARHGVCQDFTHIMIIALRSLGIPAGYVSGVLRTQPPPGQPRLEGADAMHAWVSAWCGAAAGWIDYDPTNAVQVDAEHIFIARGRDYADVAPIRGAVRTTGEQQSTHAVDVIAVDAATRF